MRKYIFLSLGTLGDVLPFLQIAKRLPDANQVVFLGAEPHAATVKAWGFQFESVLSRAEYKSVVQHPDFWRAHHGLKLFLTELSAQPAAAIFAKIRALSMDQDCVLICQQNQPAGFVAAEALGLPIVSVFIQPYALALESASDPLKVGPLQDRISRRLPLFARRAFFHAYRQQMNRWLTPIRELRRREALPPLPDFFGEGRFQADAVIGLWPDWFCAPRAEWPSQFRCLDFVNEDGAGGLAPLAPELDAFLHREPIVFALGGGMIQHFHHQFELFKGVSRRMERPVLFVAPAFEQETPQFFGNDFLMVRSVPHQEVFARASAIVHHGGYGSMVKGFALGKPALALPIAFDQFDNAYRLQRTGRGLALPFHHANIRNLCVAIEQLTACASIARPTRFIGDAKSAEIILNLESSHEMASRSS